MYMRNPRYTFWRHVPHKSTTPFGNYGRPCKRCGRLNTIRNDPRMPDVREPLTSCRQYSVSKRYLIILRTMPMFTRVAYAVIVLFYAGYAILSGHWIVAPIGITAVVFVIALVVVKLSQPNK